MELNPIPTMTKTEARQFANVLTQTVFRDRSEKNQSTKLTDRQKMVANLAISQLLDSSDETVKLELEQTELSDLVRVAQEALEDPRGIMFGLIAPELDMDDTFHWDERGNALRSLAITADFVRLARPRREGS